jgi:hypothetical protein
MCRRGQNSTQRHRKWEPIVNRIPALSKTKSNSLGNIPRWRRTWKPQQPRYKELVMGTSHQPRQKICRAMVENLCSIQIGGFVGNKTKKGDSPIRRAKTQVRVYLAGGMIVLIDRDQHAARAVRLGTT